MEIKGRCNIMRSVFTVNDIKNIIKSAYESCTEPIDLKDPETKTKTTEDLVKYLNVKFYVWRNRIIEVNGQNLKMDDWLKSINRNIKQSYALVELTDEEVTASQDIDAATKIGKITFIIQTDKVNNLDFIIQKCRSKFMGDVQKIINSFGSPISAYLTLGTLIYDDNPVPTQFGECILVSAGFRLSYLNESLSYGDTKVEISLTTDDEYDLKGNIIGTTNYMEMPILKSTYQSIFASNPVPTQMRPDLTGIVATSITAVKTLSFFDINKPLTMAFNDIFWSCGAIRINGILVPPRDVNIPVFLRITSNGKTYVFKDMIDNMQKVLTNNDFNICSVTLKTWGKLGGFIVPTP